MNLGQTLEIPIALTATFNNISTDLRANARAQVCVCVCE